MIELENEIERLNGLISQFKGLLNALPDPVFMKDENLLWIYGNPTILKLYSIDPDNYIGKSEDQLLPVEFAESCMQSDQNAKNSHQIEISEERARDDEKKMHYYEVFKVPVFDEKEYFKGLIGIGRDITERKEAQQELEKTCNYLRDIVQIDFLTGVYNAYSFSMNVQKTIDNNDSIKYCIVIIKLCNLGFINDTIGYDGGESILTKFGYMLSQFIKSNEYVGRMGGSRFSLFCHYENHEEFLIRMQNLFQITDKISTDVAVKLSAGVSISSITAKATDLIYQADYSIRHTKKETNSHSLNFYNEIVVT